MQAIGPLPRLDPVNTFFWTAGADGVLRVLGCNACKGHIHPPRPICPHCLSEDLAPVDLPGTGVVDTFTVNRQKWHPAMEVPFVIARVALDGAPGVFLTTNVVECDPESVDIGDRVSVRFIEQEDVFLPVFSPITDKAL